MRALICFALIAMTAPAFACFFDTDCSPGSSCMKAPGAIYGLCGGGLFPGNSHDHRPVEDPLDVNHSVGNTCHFDVDCGPGSICRMGEGIEGVCTR